MNRIEYWLSGKNGLWYFHILNNQGKTNFTSIGCYSKQACLDTLHNHLNTIDQYEIIELPPQIHSSRPAIPTSFLQHHSDPVHITSSKHDMQPSPLSP